MGETHDIKEGHCLVCNKTYNRTDVEYGAPGPPTEGDVSVCLYCGTICFFDKDMNLREVTEKELKDLANEDRTLYRYVTESQRFIHARNRKN